LEIGQDSRIDLSGSQAKFLVLPYGSDVKTAMQRFQLGDGQYFGTHDPLPTSDNPGRRSLFVAFAYRSIESETAYFYYRSLNGLLVQTWVSNLDGDNFSLIDLAASDATGYESKLNSSNRLVPLVELPIAREHAAWVIVQVDSIFPLWVNYSVLSEKQFSQTRSKTLFPDGLLLGALFSLMIVALQGLYYRQAKDYALFLLAAMLLSAWYLILLEHWFGPDSRALRRFSFGGPVFAYFVLHCIGIWRLAYYPKGLKITRAVRFGKFLLWMAFTYSATGFAYFWLYAIFGMHTPCPAALNALTEHVFAVVPLLLVGAVALAIRHARPGIGLLFVAEIFGATGAMMQFVRINSVWLDTPILSALTQYPLVFEMIVWALALMTRFRHLELIASRRVRAARDRAVARARDALAETVRNREGALRALESTFQSLQHERHHMVSCVRTHSHAVSGLLMRLGRQLDYTRTSDASSAIAPYEATLGEVAESVQYLRNSVKDLESARSTAIRIYDIVHWHVNSTRQTLAKRDVAIDLYSPPEYNVVLADGFLVMEVIRELLTNVERYALSHSTATVRMMCDDRYVTIEVRNQADLRIDDWKLRHGWPVDPSPRTCNGDVSSGRGLATLNELLIGVGGCVKYAKESPNWAVVTVRLPRSDVVIPA
jgi:signal transduction histidine kinase